MTRITGTTYKCNQCSKEEHEKDKVLDWLIVSSMRDEIAPMRSAIETINLTGQCWDFCCLECLAEWAMEETQ